MAHVHVRLFTALVEMDDWKHASELHALFERSGWAEPASFPVACAFLCRKVKRILDAPTAHCQTPFKRLLAISALPKEDARHMLQQALPVLRLLGPFISSDPGLLTTLARVC
jgi:hypothetical protein